MNLPSSPAAERNKEPILKVIRPWLGAGARVLEVASGTGQHAEYFAKQMPDIEWQPSDLADKLPGLRRRYAIAECENLQPPVPFDAAHPDVSMGRFDAIFMANGLQIMPFSAFEKLAENLPELLVQNGQFITYSPFRFETREFEPSNRKFDQMLRNRASHMGVRLFEDVRAALEPHGMEFVEDVAMPANNYILRFRRG
jgi:SAM-dependent methyltransferase